jgi:hypothetical protein
LELATKVHGKYRIIAIGAAGSVYVSLCAPKLCVERQMVGWDMLEQYVRDRLMCIGIFGVEIELKMFVIGKVYGSCSTEGM